jgi:hypothetical protein
MFWNRNPQSQATPDELRQKLARNLPTTPEDLALNRQGKLSDAQQVEFAGMMQQGQKAMMIIVPLVLLIAFGGLGWMIFGNEDMGGGALREVFSTNPIIPIVGIGGSLLLYLVVVGYAYLKSSRANPATIKVHSASGKIKIQVYEAWGHTYAIAAAGGAATRSIMLNVGRQRIVSTNPSVEDALENGANYRIYYIKTGGVGYFVSAEVES